MRASLYSAFVAVLASTLVSTAVGQRLEKRLDAAFRTIEVVSYQSGEVVRYVPVRVRLTDSEDRPLKAFTCTEVGESLVLLAANVGADVDPVEVTALAEMAKKQLGQSVQVSKLTPKSREASLILGEQTFNIGGVPTNPFEAFAVWQTVGMTGLKSAKEATIIVRTMWTEQLPATNLRYRVDWVSILKDLELRAGAMNRLSAEEVNQVSRTALEKEWIRIVATDAAAPSLATLSKSEITDVAATFIARALLSREEIGSSRGRSSETDFGGAFRLKEKIEISKFSTVLDLSRSVEIDRTFTFKQSIPLCR